MLNGLRPMSIFWIKGHSPQWIRHTFKISLKICEAGCALARPMKFGAPCPLPEEVCHGNRECLFDRCARCSDHERPTRPFGLLARQSDGGVSRLSRARISFPVLKAGI